MQGYRILIFGQVKVSVFDVSVAPLGTVRKYFRDSTGRPVDGILGNGFPDKRSGSSRRELRADLSRSALDREK